MFCRWQYLQDKTLKTLNLKADKWSKLAQSEDYQSLIQTFLDKGDNLALLINFATSGQLQASYSFPASLKQKGENLRLFTFQKSFCVFRAF